ncbi:hypothetical protein SNOG_15559 [Parastagonospora nodorum SN15]|uniref:Uncharacterized protein n=1 Tax=Phaeosphaeria nodorum (strain SN15 / ATCC MYA-4574 / FGSC 10173) TaxID=321614 RepID=Q0TXT5_PHANO|nr:hypothetical protein SNOG_15559 [Parastagonospora nodorum SN15]EAT76934.1 hypothetical protein SNOG_15559 [Parastagonospora nodorum SN15]
MAPDPAAIDPFHGSMNTMLISSRLYNPYTSLPRSVLAFTNRPSPPTGTPLVIVLTTTPLIGTDTDHNGSLVHSSRPRPSAE